MGYHELDTTNGLSPLQFQAITLPMLFNLNDISIQIYRKISNIRRTKSQSFTVSRFDIFKPSVKWRMKM